MTTRWTASSFAAALAVGALTLAGCSGAGDDAPGPATDAAQDQGSAEEPAEPENESGGDGEEAVVNVAFDGEPVEFEEEFCKPSPGNEGRMRLMAFYDGGELKVDADDDGVHILLETTDERTYQSREPNGIDFDDGLAQGDVEITDADDDLIVVTLDLDC